MDGRRHLVKDGLGWGAALWLIGYSLGMLFFLIMPSEMIGWFVTPIGVAITCVVLWKWVDVRSFQDAVLIGLAWALLAIVLDYVFIVQLLKPIDGYYKLDVYLYYASMLLMPLIAATLRRNRSPVLPD